MNRREVLIGSAAVAASRSLRGQSILAPLFSGRGQSYPPLVLPIVGGNVQTTPFARLSFTKTGAKPILDWGDGSAPGSATSGAFPSHAYPAASQIYQLTASSPDGWAGVTQLTLSQGQGSGVSPYTGVGNNQVPPPQYPAAMPSFAFMENLQYLLSADTGFYYNFPIADLSIFPALQHVDVQGNSFTGDAPRYTNCPNLLYVDMHVAFGNNGTPATLYPFTNSPLLQWFESHASKWANCPSFAANIALQHFGAGNGCFGAVTGSLPSFATCTQLQLFQIDNSTFTGTIPDFSPCTALTSWSASGHTFTGVTAGSFATQASLATLNLFFGNLTSAAVNQVLADCVASLSLPGRVTCTVSLNGLTNGAPTGAGVTNKATLQAAGWTVTTN